jgi:hypothetical protein
MWNSLTKFSQEPRIHDNMHHANKSESYHINRSKHQVQERICKEIKFEDRKSHCRMNSVQF